MNTKHTPGPWEIDRDALENPAALNGGDNMRRVLLWGAFAKRNTQEAEANARLIAAAPELLEAAQAVIEIVDGLTRAEQNDLPNMKLNALRDAIAKATGKTLSP